jgi:hypothetical protein
MEKRGFSPVGSIFPHAAGARTFPDWRGPRFAAISWNAWVCPAGRPRASIPTLRAAHGRALRWSAGKGGALGAGACALPFHAHQTPVRQTAGVARFPAFGGKIMGTPDMVVLNVLSLRHLAEPAKYRLLAARIVALLPGAAILLSRPGVSLDRRGYWRVVRPFPRRHNCYICRYIGGLPGLRRRFASICFYMYRIFAGVLESGAAPRRARTGIVCRRLVGEAAE